MYAPRRPDHRRLVQLPPGTPRTPCGNRFGIGRRRWFPFDAWLPYGRWDCAVGRSVLFNRRYEPIHQCRPVAPAEHAGPTEWIERAVSRIPGAG
jgi:hypothetical protein